MAAELHLYQCWVCRTTLTVTVNASRTGSPYRCRACYPTPMTYKFSVPIETDEDRALAARCPVYNHHVEIKPQTTRPCDTCRQRVERADMLVLECVGKFCSDACATVGIHKHKELMQRVEALYQERPWLRPGA